MDTATAPLRYSTTTTTTTAYRYSTAVARRARVGAALLVAEPQLQRERNKL